jgi:hypothetical protein
MAKIASTEGVPRAHSRSLNDLNSCRIEGYGNFPNSLFRLALKLSFYTDMPSEPAALADTKRRWRIHWSRLLAAKHAEASTL